MESYWSELSRYGIGACMRALRKAAFAALTCTFTLGGAVIGSIFGALKGQTTESGLFRGAMIGTVAGAVVAVEVLESCLQGELLSKVAIFGSLVNGKIFREWVSPAMLKAYLWQIDTVEANHGESSDIFDSSRNTGLPRAIIKKLPEFEIKSGRGVDLPAEMTPCAVCLQELETRERARRLPSCGHFFHTLCIDGWLVAHGTCPICRQEVRIEPLSSSCN